MVHVPVRPSSGVIGWYGAVTTTRTVSLLKSHGLDEAPV
jgi:hypothetical protein